MVIVAGAMIVSCNGHDYVDLGLPSGVKWATRNVGAEKPEDYGDYFAWGETSPKEEYTSENSVTFGEDIGDDISGKVRYDAATVNWGRNWRMPTKEQMHELLEHCEWGLTQLNGVNGAKLIGPNVNSIFLPAACYRIGSSLIGYGLGNYWSSTPYFYSAYALIFNDGCYESLYSNNGRSWGLPVRPITE